MLNHMPWDYSTDDILKAGCVPPRSYTHIDFDNAVLVQSNLGGQGGRCSETSYMQNGQVVAVTWSQLCSEPQPGAQSRSAQAKYRSIALINHLARRVCLHRLVPNAVE